MSYWCWFEARFHSAANLSHQATNSIKTMMHPTNSPKLFRKHIGWWCCPLICLWYASNIASPPSQNKVTLLPPRGPSIKRHASKEARFPAKPKELWWVVSKDRYPRKKRDYVGKIPKLGGGGSDPNPLLDVYLPSYFWHAKMILRC